MSDEMEMEGVELTDNELDSEDDDPGEDNFELGGVEREQYTDRMENEQQQVDLGMVSSKKWEPEIGMVFENDEQAYRFYYEYARRIGFSIRKQHMSRNSNGQIWGRMFVCYKEGFYQMKKAVVDRSRERSGCKAHIGIKRLKDGKFVLYRFVAQHNHELTPIHLLGKLRTQKKMAKLEMVEGNRGGRAEVKVKGILEFLPITAGGRSEVPFAHLSFSSNKVREHEMRPGDEEAVICYLQGKAAEDQRFYSAILLDSKDQMMNVFWRDARSKVDYEYFGDVVCFDTTYRINEFGRPFASFYGVNHHKQMVVFGASLLYDETVDTYKWLFRTFRDAFSGKAPLVILTDASKAISAALMEVWPETAHRLCVWQMHQDAMKHLKHVFQGLRNFKTDFARCLYEYEDEEEFLSAWEAMLKKYHLGNNSWLSMIFEDRKKWALVYGREMFYGDMKDVQTNDDINFALRKFLHADRDLASFFRCYDKVVSDRRYNESEADFRASQSSTAVPHTRLLKQAAAAYTPRVYEMFAKEYQQYLDSMVEECGEIGTGKKFKITNVETGRTGYVVHDSSNDTLSCSCCKFEFLGILCWHVLKVLDHMNIKEVPDKYILKRWKKHAKSGVGVDLDDCSVEVDPKVAISNRFNSLGRVYGQIMAKGSWSQEAYEVAVQEAQTVLRKMDQVLQKKAHVANHPQASIGQAQDTVASEAVPIRSSEQPTELPLARTMHSDSQKSG